MLIKQLRSKTDLVRGFVTSNVRGLQKKETSEDESDVVFFDVGRKGLIVLNRPKQLNALNHSMAKKILDVLHKWKYEKNLVVVKGSGEKAFCAGGDVVAVTRDKTGREGRNYFRDEYKLDGLIASLTFPYVALLNGIVMGGGVGLSINGKFRVVTENALFAMPETQIGLFPDVGVSHFLSRMPHNLGVFLALTGYRLKGYDLYHAGVGTHYCSKDKLGNLESSLLSESPTSKKTDVENILEEYHCSSVDSIKSKGLPPPFSLASHLNTINTCFSYETVEKILSSLECENSCFAQEMSKVLKQMSPLAMKITLKQILNAKRLDIYECLNTDYRIASRVLETTEFYEGVRALLVDKDKKPKWNPPELSQISDLDIDKYFSALPPNEELNLPCAIEKVEKSTS